MPRYRTFQHLEEYLVSNLPYRVHSISLEKAQPGRELWHGGDSWLHDDKVAEWLRRWTANPMCSARVGSNPILVDNFYPDNPFSGGRITSRICISYRLTTLYLEGHILHNKIEKELCAPGWARTTNLSVNSRTR